VMPYYLRNPKVTSFFWFLLLTFTLATVNNLVKRASNDLKTVLMGLEPALRFVFFDIFDELAKKLDHTISLEKFCTTLRLALLSILSVLNQFRSPQGKKISLDTLLKIVNYLVRANVLTYIDPLTVEIHSRIYRSAYIEHVKGSEIEKNCKTVEEEDK
jgi:hypothetical protein